MAQRLQLISDRISKQPSFVNSSFDFLDMASMLTQSQNDVRLKLRNFMETQVQSHIDKYVENAQFPEFLLSKLKQLDPLQYFLKPPYGKPLSTFAQGCLVAEMARIDPGVCTMIVVQWGLVCFTIQALGSEQQKLKYLPKLQSFDMIGGWGLTEESIGSDASSLQTSAQKTKNNNYRLNGTKRWIGNGNRDVLIVWARNTENKNVEGFIVENKNVSGLTSRVMKNKLSLRIVQNCHITLDNVIVPESQKLPKAKNFGTGTNVVLKHSRLFVCWVAAGICMGVYDSAIKYVSARKQFGKSISGFQLVQEKIVKIMANTQAVFLMCYRISQLADNKNIGIGQIAMVKAWATERAREVSRWGRQVFGGNGILHEQYVMRALADAEAIYTYEGTYDINTLVTGRELTGLPAFK